MRLKEIIIIIRGIGEQDILPDWQAAIKRAGLDKDNPQSWQFLSQMADISRTFVYQLLCGRSTPNREQAERIIQACEPLIQARKERGEIINLE